jgi:hypothetical protein
MDDRPLHNPRPGDIVEAVIDGQHVVCLVTMVITENIESIIYDTFTDGRLSPHCKTSIFRWQEWCRTHGATVKHS